MAAMAEPKSPFPALIGRRLYPRLAVLLALMVLAAATEGLGLVLLMPMLELVGTGMGVGTEILGHLGLAPRLEVLLPLFVALVAARSAIVYARTLASLRFEAAVVDGLRERAWRGLLHCDWRTLLAMKRSDSASLLINRVDQAGDFVNQAIAAVSTSVTLGGLAVAALAISPTFAFASIASGAGILALLHPARRQARDLGEQLGRSHAAIQGKVTEGLGAIRTIKAFGLEERAGDDLVREFAGLRRAIIAFHRAKGAAQALLQILGAVLLAVLVWLAIAKGHLPVAAILPMVALFARALPLVGLLQQAWSNCRHDRPAVDEALQLVTLTEGAAEDPADGRSVPQLHREIGLDRVTVQFAGEGRPALDSICLAMPARGITALTGPSGAGKSTLADVLGGLLDPDRGRLTVDGVEISGPLRQAWRRRVAYVQQDPALISASLRDNLRWASPQAPDAEMIAALKASAANFALNLPQGLGTMLGDGGRQLSGGERQRLMLARALLCDPALLILDEATSALDATSEAQIAKALRELSKRLSILIISHRGLLIDLAEQEVRLEKGRLIDPH